MVIPKQAIPPIEGQPGLFTKAWYLALNELASRAASETPPLEWTRITTFVNGWTDAVAGPYGDPAYAVEGNSLHIRGVIASGTKANFTPMFTLPADATPANRAIVLCTYFDTVTLAYTSCSVLVQESGEVKIVGGASANPTYIFLSVKVPLN